MISSPHIIMLNGALKQTARCIAEHRKPLYAEHIDTEKQTPAQVCDYILHRL